MLRKLYRFHSHAIVLSSSKGNGGRNVILSQRGGTQKGKENYRISFIFSFLHRFTNGSKNNGLTDFFFFFKVTEQSLFFSLRLCCSTLRVVLTVPHRGARRGLPAFGGTVTWPTACFLPYLCSSAPPQKNFPRTASYFILSWPPPSVTLSQYPLNFLLSASIKPKLLY